MATRLSIAAGIITAAATLPVLPVMAEPASRIQFVAGPLKAEGGFDLDKQEHRLALSAIACAGSGCVVGFDEGRSARYVTLTETQYVARPEPLRLRDGKPKDELDVEAAAIGDGKLYMVSSHAKARKLTKKNVPEDMDGLKCKPHPSAIGIYRFMLDSSTGLPSPSARPDDPDGRPFIAVVERAGRTRPDLGNAVDRCLVLGKGLDVEGLAFKEGALFFGLRGPKPAGDKAFVLSAPADALFAGSAPEPQIHEVTVGEGRAIRDMHRIEDGFLILAGPDDIPENQTRPFSLVHWDGAGTATELGVLPVADRKRPDDQDGCRDETVKPEALAVTARLEKGWRVVVLSDGLCDGGPMWFDVTR